MNKTIAAIIIIALLVLGIFYYIYKSPQTKTSTPSQTSASQSASPASILANLNIDLKTAAVPRPTTDWDFIDASGNHQPLSAQMITLGTTDANGLGMYGGIKNNDISQVTKPFIESLLATITTSLKKQGFTQTSFGNADYNDMNNKRVQFENGNTKCIVSVDVSTDPFASIICGTVDQKQLALDTEFKNVADPKLINDTRYFYRVEKVEGDYAQGVEGGQLGGGWFAKKVNGTWTILMRSHEIPLCSDMQKYQIPQSIYQNCYAP